MDKKRTPEIMQIIKESWINWGLSLDDPGIPLALVEMENRIKEYLGKTHIYVNLSASHELDVIHPDDIGVHITEDYGIPW